MRRLLRRIWARLIGDCPDCANGTCEAIMGKGAVASASAETRLAANTATAPAPPEEIVK